MPSTYVKLGSQDNSGYDFNLLSYVTLYTHLLRNGELIFYRIEGDIRTREKGADLVDNKAKKGLTSLVAYNIIQLWVI